MEIKTAERVRDFENIPHCHELNVLTIQTCSCIQIYEDKRLPGPVPIKDLDNETEIILLVCNHLEKKRCTQIQRQGAPFV